MNILKNIIRSVFIIMVFSLLLTTFSCKKNNGTRTLNSEPVIYTGIAPIAFILDNIVKDKVKVKILIKSGQDPHSFEPAPRDIADVMSSKGYFLINLPFEETLIEKISKQNPSFPVYNISQSIQYLDHPDEGDAQQAPVDSPDHNHDEELDVHIWMSLKNIKLIGESAYQYLCKLFPEFNDEFSANYKLMVQKIEQLDRQLSKDLESQADSAFFVFHPAYGYFARDYNLHQISIEVNGKPPTGKNLEKFIQLAKKEKVHYIIIQPEIPASEIKILINELQIIPITISPLDYNLFGIFEKLTEIIEGNNI